MPTDLRALLAEPGPLILPGAHDALTARMIERAGFAAYGIGGSALAATQLALPDLGLLSFGEYRDAVGRILEATTLPVIVDAENGFGDVKATTRTVRCFERMGAAALAFEDLVLPPRTDRPPALVPAADMAGKPEAALAARSNQRLFIIGRTDAAYAVDLDEAMARAAAYAAVGIDGLIVTGLPDLAAYRRLRNTVRVPIFAVVVPGSPWFAPTQAELAATGIEAALYPAAVLPRVTRAIAQGLAAIRASNGGPPPAIDPTDLRAVFNTQHWADIDQRFAPA